MSAADVRVPLAAPPMTRRRRWQAAWRRPETRWAYLFLLPWILGFLVFTAGPMLASLVLSFTDYDVINPATYVGGENYQRMVEDPEVRTALFNTVLYTVIHVPLSIAIALALAVLLNQIGGRFAGFFRTVFYLPAMTPTVAVGVLFLLLLNGQNGLVNALLRLFGINGPAWTTDPDWVRWGIIIMSLWTIGGTIVILFAALKNVPNDLYEAARIDGAGAWRQFREVTVPMISGSLFFVTIVNTIASLQMFTEVYTMFYGNAQSELQASDSALFYVIYLFQQGFQFLEMGYASALAWGLFAIVLIVTLVQVKLGDRFVYYEGDDR
ncbi:carbohydrate ABC transporter permease [Jiangella asiatica]|nr:sugar ABC transporter permease [Jiangella asiatica]